MDIFEFEELVAEMLDITDEEREDESHIEAEFFKRFNFEFELGFELALALLPHVPRVKSAMLDCEYHAFVSKHHDYMLMKIKCPKS